ncbi:MAG: amidohydrolase family protein, partial [Pseudolabrys sp.]
MVKKIALEEHFLDPATEAYWRPTMVDVAPAKTAQLYASLTDFSGQRLQMMDKTGIARAVLAIAGPGVQAERDAAVAVRAARASNDFLAKEVQKRPDRYSGFAHLAMQDAKAAADELDRCVRDLKFCGAMINGHTNGQYLDDRALDPFWERVAALDTVVYLHPADPVAPLPAIDGYNVLARPMWGWG